MQEIIKIPAEVDATDVQPFFRMCPNHSMDGYSAEQCEAINDFLSHIEQFGFSYNSKDIIAIKKQDSNLYINISKTF